MDSTQTVKSGGYCTVNQILDKCNASIVQKLEISDVFLSKLVTRSVIHDENRQMIMSKDTPYRKAYELIDILRRKSNDSFDVFCEILREYNPDLAEELSRSKQTNANSNINPRGAGCSGGGLEKNTSSNATEPEFIDARRLPFLVVKVKPGTREFYDLHSGEATYQIVPGKSRGRAHIINVKNADGCEERTSTDCDRDNLKNLFEGLEFTVHCFDDIDGLKAEEIRTKIEKMAKLENDFQDAQCFVLCILSHGATDPENQKGYFVGTDGKRVYNDDVFNNFNDQNCPALKGKPRLIFFQACRKIPDEQKDADVRLPDFLVGYPTQKDKYAYRIESGSIYIRQIADVFMNSAFDTDLKTMMEKVKETVIQKNRELKLSEMIPETISNLTRTFYFFPRTSPF